jgi:hypothetical protein
MLLGPFKVVGSITQENTGPIRGCRQHHPGERWARSRPSAEPPSNISGPIRGHWHSITQENAGPIQGHRQNLSVIFSGPFKHIGGTSQ